MEDNTYFSYFLHVPDTSPFDDPLTKFTSWVGNFVRPLFYQKAQFTYWFSHYENPNHDYHLRIWTTESAHRTVEQPLRDLMSQYGLTFQPGHDIRKDSIIDDLGHHRWLSDETEQSGKTRLERAEMILAFLHATSELMVDSLVKIENEKWTYENTPHKDNPTGNYIESVRHLFYMITDVPLWLYYPPPQTYGGPSIGETNILLEGREIAVKQFRY